MLVLILLTNVITTILCLQDSLFDGISPKLDDHSGEYKKTNCRRLILKHRPSGGGDGIPRTDILKHILSKDDNKENQKDINEIDLIVSNELKSAPLKLNFDNTLDDHIKHIGSQTYNLANMSTVRNDSSIGKYEYQFIFQVISCWQVYMSVTMSHKICHIKIFS